MTEPRNRLEKRRNAAEVPDFPAGAHRGAGLVLVAAWRDGTGFDALRRYFAYGTEAVGGEKTVYRYDTDNTNRFARVGTGSLVILSDTSLRLLGPDGSEVWSANVKMNAPALGQGGGLAVAYDIGGTALYVLDEEGPRLELTADGPLVSANLNGSGMLAVTTQISGTKGHVDVYGADMQVLFAFNAHRPLCGGCLRDGGRRLFGRRDHGAGGQRVYQRSGDLRSDAGGPRGGLRRAGRAGDGHDRPGGSDPHRHRYLSGGGKYRRKASGHLFLQW